MHAVGRSLDVEAGALPGLLAELAGLRFSGVEVDFAQLLQDAPDNSNQRGLGAECPPRCKTEEATMASGDAQRLWFPEMLAELRKAWSARMPWADLADLCSRMTDLRTEIRRARGITGPMMRCNCCAEVFDGGSDRRVSIRSALFALRKEGVLTEFRFKKLDAKWKKHRKAKGLDAYGWPAAPDPSQATKRRMQG